MSFVCFLIWTSKTFFFKLWIKLFVKISAEKSKPIKSSKLAMSRTFFRPRILVTFMSQSFGSCCPLNYIVFSDRLITYWSTTREKQLRNLVSVWHRQEIFMQKFMWRSNTLKRKVVFAKIDDVKIDVIVLCCSVILWSAYHMLCSSLSGW